VQNLHEIGAEQTKLTEIQANKRKAKGTELNNLIVDEQNAKAKIQILQAQGELNEQKIRRESAKVIQGIEDEKNKALLKGQKEQKDKVLSLVKSEAENKAALVDAQYQGEIEQLNEFYKAGRISQDEYNKRRLNADFEYHVKVLKQAIENAKKIIAIEALLGIDISKEKKALAKLEFDLSNLTTKHHIDTENEKLQATISTFEKIKEVGDKVFSLIDGIININTIAQKNALQAQSDANEKKAARDIEIVNGSVLSEQDKAAKIIVINARLQVQKAQIAQRERQIQETQAKADKVKAIFEITINTAIAISKVLGNPFLVALTAAFGAAQLAIAIATPIPKFKTGLQTDYEGLGIVGDGGKPEAILRAGGGIEITPSTDTLTYINKGDRILPDIADLQNMALRDIARVANGKAISNNGYEQIATASMVQNAELQKENHKLLKKLIDKPVQSISSDHAGMVGVWSWGAKQKRYIDENTNW
jgi:hypothetical protein